MFYIYSSINELFFTFIQANKCFTFILPKFMLRYKWCFLYKPLIHMETLSIYAISTRMFKIYHNQSVVICSYLWSYVLFVQIARESFATSFVGPRQTRIPKTIASLVKNFRTSVIQSRVLICWWEWSRTW